MGRWRAILAAMIIAMAAGCGSPDLAPRHQLAPTPPPAPVAATPPPAGQSQSDPATPPPAGQSDPATPADTAPRPIRVGLRELPETLLPPPGSPAAEEILAALQPACAPEIAFAVRNVCFEPFADAPAGDAPGLSVSGATVSAAELQPIMLDGVLTTTAGLAGPLELAQARIVFRLLPGLAWEDGTPLGADDFIEGYRLSREPLFRPADDWLLARTARLERLDERSFAWVGIPGYLPAGEPVGHAFPPQPHHLLKGLSAQEIAAGPYARRPLSYGPYKLAAFEPGVRALLAPNPRPWRPGASVPQAVGLEFRALGDVPALLAALERGEIDLIPSGALAFDDLAALAALRDRDPAIALAAAPSATWEHLDFGMLTAAGGKAPLADPALRQALASAIDRQAIADAALRGLGGPLDSFLPAQHLAALAPADAGLPGFDPERSRALLKDSGWQPGPGGWLERDGQPLVLELHTTSQSAIRLEVAEAIRSQLAAVGVSVTLRLASGGAALFQSSADSPLAGHRFDLALYAWTSFQPLAAAENYGCDAIPGPANQFQGYNYPGHCDPAFEAELARLRSPRHRWEAEDAARAAQQIVSANLPMLPLFQRPKVAAHRAALLGVTPDPGFAPDAWNVEQWRLANAPAPADPIPAPPTPAPSPALTETIEPALLPAPLIEPIEPAPDATAPLTTAIPPAPADWGDYPAVIEDFLNAAPGNAAQMDRLVDEWHAQIAPTIDFNAYGLESTATYQKHFLKRADLDGDGGEEFILGIAPIRYDGDPAQRGLAAQMLMVIGIVDQQYQVTLLRHNDQYPASDSQAAIPVKLAEIDDYNGDGLLELFVVDHWCGAHTCFTIPLLFNWEKGTFVSLIDNGNEMNQLDPIEPHVPSSYVNVSFVDQDGDGIRELIRSGGTVGSAGAGQQRGSIARHRWNGQAYVLDWLDFDPVDSADDLWYLVDSGRAFRDGDYEKASGYALLALDPASDTMREVPHDLIVQAARFQMMVISLALGNEREAEAWHQASREELPEWSDALWNAYQRSGDIREACAAATAAYPDAVVMRAGYSGLSSAEITCLFR
ncbi:MAG TPA: ABC transporter substrate-binding protein [Herpetosiphonaceae bacterium]